MYHSMNQRAMRSDVESFNFQIHSKLITTAQLAERMKSLVPEGTFEIRMQHNVHHVTVNLRGKRTTFPPKFRGSRITKGEDPSSTPETTPDSDP